MSAPDCTQTSATVTVCSPPPSGVNVYSDYVSAVLITVVLVVVAAFGVITVWGAVLKARAKHEIACPKCGATIRARMADR